MLYKCFVLYYYIFILKEHVFYMLKTFPLLHQKANNNNCKGGRNIQRNIAPISIVLQSQLILTLVVYDV